MPKFIGRVRKGMKAETLAWKKPKVRPNKALVFGSHGRASLLRANFWR